RMQAGAHRTGRRHFSLRAATQYTVHAKGRAARRRRGGSSRIVRWIQQWIKDLEPAVDRLVTADGRYKKVARSGRRHVRNPDRFGSVAPKLQAARFAKLDGCRTAQRLNPQMALCIDVAARSVTTSIVGGIGQYNDGELQPFRLVDSHHP